VRQEASLTSQFTIDATDRRIFEETQGGLCLCSDPYGAIAAAVGISTEEVMGRIRHMMAKGAIRRIGAVPNHYAVGLRANGMSVWDVADEQVSELGRVVGTLTFVSHCYRRPRRLPDWPYNLFAMVHGQDRSEVEAKVVDISRVLGDACRGHDLIYSSRILKKTGLRVSREGEI